MCLSVLENAERIAAHEYPRTTKVYDETGDAITLDEVEWIAIGQPSLFKLLFLS
jgi:hypothetical protein